MGDSAATVFCRCCADYRPFRVLPRVIDGEACSDLCCDDCHCQIAVFRGASPFGMTADLARRLTAAQSGADETISTPAPDVPAEMKE